mmetsp:Transcript_29418/g.53984  ORF Transcript_29418/g.53984 Transcript_29418/m.53984 type:complete len:81 (-) Transcript_29418:1060-1302(-)
MVTQKGWQALLILPSYRDNAPWKPPLLLDGCANICSTLFVDFESVAHLAFMGVDGAYLKLPQHHMVVPPTPSPSRWATAA